MGVATVGKEGHLPTPAPLNELKQFFYIIIIYYWNFYNLVLIPPPLLKS